MMNNQTIQNPNAPATPRQTFACFVKTGYDVRGCNLNMQQASNILDGKLDPAILPGAIQKRKAAAAKIDFAAIHAEAHASGMEAGNSVIPAPMIVSERVNPLDDSSAITKVYQPVMDGVCGFAWVSFAGNTAWAKWAKVNRIASKHYPLGYCVWVGHFNQSLTRKESYADAYCKVLNKHGIKAYVGSRMD